MVEFNGMDVIIMTCSDCNTDCKHCYIGYSGNFSANDLYNLCLKLKEKYHVFLNGTEILLHEEYFETQSHCGGSSHHSALLSDEYFE